MNKGYYITTDGTKVEFKDKELLNLTYKNIVELNLDNCINLKQLYCYNNQLTSLDLNDLKKFSDKTKSAFKNGKR